MWATFVAQLNEIAAEAAPEDGRGAVALPLLTRCHGDHSPVVHSDQLDYTPFPESVRLARRRAARLTGEWGHPELAGDAALLVSEMASNALLHGCGTGRGSLFLDALATRWGTEISGASEASGAIGHGKTVWCELDLSGPGR